MNDTVDEVIRVAQAEDIDADIVRGGELTVARNDAHTRACAPRRPGSSAGAMRCC